MSPERWREIENLFQAALARDPKERAEFLVEASAGDEALRLEVESLLASHESAAGFTGAPAEVAAAMLAEGRAQATLGRDLGHYRLLSMLGAGGMGEVYRARDTTLGREVALKILPEEATRDPDRLRRFEQEARAASALNHPNILTIYEIGRADNTYYIAAELVEGETLRQRVAKGRLDSRLALDIGAQVAGALSAAHAAGIVHRDIKPENIMCRRDGYVKVLDFGVAKLTTPPPFVLNTESPTLGEVKTDVGMVIGTAGYMSPEQVRGLEVDGRADLFSLGVVLYEMVTGARPFPGDHVNDVIASILKSEPLPIRHHLLEVPAELERIVSKALAKDREERYQGARDLQIDLKNLRQELELQARVRRSLPTEPSERQASGPSEPAGILGTSAAARERKPGSSWKLVAQIAIGAAIFFALLPLAFRFRPTRQPAEPPLRKFPITVEGASWGTAHDDLLGPVISPNGRHIAYTVGLGAQRRIWVHDLDQVSARELPGTEAAHSLFWSPDSQFIGFGTFPSVNPALKKVSVRGGAPSVLCSLNGRELLGATWTPGGTIIFMPFNAFGGLYQVSADGGPVKPLTQVDAKAEWSHRNPFLLPDGRSLLIENLRLDHKRGIVVLAANGERKELGEGRLPVYSPTGHIVYESRGNLINGVAVFPRKPERSR
jgi:serine/threonine protein kinase